MALRELLNQFLPRLLRIPLRPVLLAAALVISPRAYSQEISFPRRPIKVIVPFTAGGGSDTFGRILQSAIEKHKLLPEKFVMINVPGAGGTIGSRRVKNARPDGYTIMLLHEGILTAKYSGKVPYGPEAFQPIAGTGQAVQVVAVTNQSALQNLGDLVEELKANPDTVVFGANLGAPSHFAGLMIEQQVKEKATFRFTQTGGGSKRIAGLQGGHMDVTSFSLSEFIQFRDGGIRALAVLGEERHPELPDTPTAREQGLDVVSINTQYWWAPKGTPVERTKVVADTLEKAIQTPEVLKALKQLQIDPTFLRGDELVQDIERRDKNTSKVDIREPQQLPNIPVVILCLVLASGVAFAWTNRQASQPDESKSNPQVHTLLLVAGCMVGYVLVLQNTTSGFVVSTIAFLTLTASLIWYLKSETAPRRAANCIAIAFLIACCFSFGIHYAFTEVLVVDLP